MITSKEARDILCEGLDYNVVCNEHTLLEVKLKICWAVLNSQSNVYFEATDFFYNDSPQSSYVWDMLEELGYCIESAKGYDENFGCNGLGIRISW